MQNSLSEVLNLTPEPTCIEHFRTFQNILLRIRRHYTGRRKAFQGKACLLIRKHDHFTPTREITFYLRSEGLPSLTLRGST
jgi:hypothetical protein